MNKNKTKNYIIGIGYTAYFVAVFTYFAKMFGAATYWCEPILLSKGEHCTDPLVFPWIIALVILIGLGVGHFRNSSYY